MIRRALVVLACVQVFARPAAPRAQEPEALQAVRQSYELLQYDSVVVRARRALESGRLSRDARIAVYEYIGYAYAALDSTQRAVEAFRELIRLDPDREPDVSRVAPRITSLYASALGQVAVVRRIRADSASFVAGQGRYRVRFQVTRPCFLVVRLIGPDVDRVVDSASVSGDTAVAWSGLAPDGGPVGPGPYVLLLRVTVGREEYETAVRMRVTHGALDTLAHLARLADYTERPELLPPPRSARALALSLLYTAGGVAAFLAVEKGSWGDAQRAGLVAVGTFTLGAGLVATARRPEPAPVEANIVFNRLLREQLAQRNAEIARQNSERRSQTLLRIVPTGGEQ